uniref:Uncharacterized protein n=1 Tax=Zeugodacus cucurbitae TaxID=28588 RepID=A0A0A1X7H5_ZEUCU
MTPSRRKCVFNKQLQEEYTFIKEINSGTVKCTKCSAVFSIANAGKHDVLRHLQSEKHRKADIAASSSKTVMSFVRTRTIDDQRRKSRINQGTWAYHTVQHNISFRSNDCTSKIIKRCFDENYSSARTKCESIVCNVLAPHALQPVKADFNAINFITFFRLLKSWKYESVSCSCSIFSA